MVQSVELLLGDDLDVVVRRQWDRLAAAGLSSQGRIRSATNRPHVTLFVAQSVPRELDAAVRDAVGSAAVLLRLGGVVVFGGRHATLARLVVPSVELLGLHARVFDVLGRCPGIPGHLRPGEWTPHVTLARRMPADRIGAAVLAVHDAPSDPAGPAAAVRRWDGDARQEWLVWRPPDPPSGRDR